MLTYTYATLYAGNLSIYIVIHMTSTFIALNE